MEHISLPLIILDRAPRIIIEWNEVSEILGDIPSSLPEQLEVPVEDVFIALELLKSKDVDHNFPKQLQVIFAVGLKVEVFGRAIFANLIKTYVG